MEEDGADRQEQVTQKIIRCRRFIAETNNPSPRYNSNTPKEELLLEHVREFEEQFVEVYGNRFLFLCPPNEYGVPKFLPTTIRATHLPYKELYDYRPCAQFMADFFNYEELNPPDRYPSVVPAPASVLKWQAGDCFDLSIALCSLLLGVGYDAYCVSGFAPRFITMRNEARSACPQLDLDLEEKAPEVEPEDEEKFVIAKKPPLRSEFQEAKKAAEALNKERLQEEEMKSDSEDDPSSDEDEYENRRVHCWVLVRKGSREVAEDFYIEPTTGRLYQVTRCPYLKVDLIWNHKNLWVNMQICNASQVQLELYSSRHFEYVMLDPENGGMGVFAETDATEETEGSKPEQAAQILDMPPPWSERPDISREAFHARCYQGEKTIFYHKCKVEQYAPYTQDDGLVQRITLYKDVRRQIPLEIRERFKHRRDKLAERRRKPMQNETVERFDPGRPSSSQIGGGALREFREIAAVSRELLFYNSRLDGLVRSVEVIGRKVFEHFDDRDDKLIYHSVTLDPSLQVNQRGNQKKDTWHVESWGDIPIRKMTQKYARTPEIEADDDIYKVCFFIAEGKIRVDYHREPGKLTYKTIMYLLEDGSLVRIPRSLPQPTQLQVTKLLQMRNQCMEFLGESHSKVHVELDQRRKEENVIRGSRSVQTGKQKRDFKIGGSREDVLEPSVYDLAREQARLGASKEGMEEEKKEETSQKMDILAPYLVDFINKATGTVQLDSLQAELVAKKCTQDFRKRLTDRAEIIQRRLEEEQDQLRKRRAQMQRRGDNVEKDERDFEKYQSQAMFRTQILEQRLARHEMQAIENFQKLERMLQDDPRLAAMWQKDPAPAPTDGRGGR
eukprot:TRINITY_DN2605_c0_g1_i1.p1 TRINITY_DN2605_c0_g1~~TRINITY_DN2605_c0_g1_i1.p1  ORF type:complete len:842 (+),score=224.22 TRINITY_DN2605_c0_g1_i1:100-2625(+)